MTRIALVALVLTLAACSPSRTASCQLLYDCCHGSSDCDPVVDQNDPGACQTQLVVSRGSGMCGDAGTADGGATHPLACVSDADAGLPTCFEATGPSVPATCPSGSSMLGACPTAAVGRCTLTTTDGDTEVVFFYAPTAATTAMQTCTAAHGTWMAN